MRTRAASHVIARPRTYQDVTPIAWGYFALTVICACLMAAGFFFAARQHFNTVEFGMKNSALRKRVDELQAEKRRLTLAREVSLSPASIRKAARGLGLKERSIETAVAIVAATTPPKTQKPKSPLIAIAATRPPEVVKAVEAVKASYSESTAKSAPSERSTKKIVLQRERKSDPAAQLLAFR